MDDVLTGAANLKSAKKFQVQLIQLLSTHGMQVYKWFSKSVCKSGHYTFEKINETKVLGLFWKAHGVTFTFSVSFSDQTKVRKRNVLSNIACRFDNLGLLDSVVTKAKIFVQRL